MSLKDSKRKAIEDSARELFDSYGYKAVSMDQIALRANVAKGTLYLYFKDKEDLFYHLVREFIDDLARFMDECEEKKLSIFDEIHEVVYNLLMYRKSQKFVYRAVREAEELKTPTSVAVKQMLDNEISGYLEKRLETAIKQKLIKPCNAAVLSFAIIKVYTALAFEWEEKHSPLNEAEIAESVRLFFKDGLLLKTE